jgi:hypothetical protein
MEWRVTIELNGAEGTKQTHEVARGGGTDPHSPLDPLGLTLDDGKTLLAGVQRHLVQGRVAEYSALRRHCSHCRGLRPLKDTRTRRLNSLFGTIEVPAPRFKPCRCAVTARATVCPASELLPDRCTPEYERTLAKMGAWLPYRCARRFLSEFFPLGADLPWRETIRRRTARVAAGIERKAVSRAKSPPAAAPSETIAVSIDARHVRAARGHQGRTFEVTAAQVSLTVQPGGPARHVAAEHLVGAGHVHHPCVAHRLVRHSLSAHRPGDRSACCAPAATSAPTATLEGVPRCGRRRIDIRRVAFRHLGDLSPGCRIVHGEVGTMRGRGPNSIVVLNDARCGPAG